MLRCDCCSLVILEQSEDELLGPDNEVDEQSDSESDAARRRRVKKKKEASQPTKRASLVSLPYKRAVNGYEYKDFDLCPDCRAALERVVADVSFGFCEGFFRRRYFIVPEYKWDEGVYIEAADAKEAAQIYNAEACVNVEIDVYASRSGVFEYIGHFILRENNVVPG